MKIKQTIIYLTLGLLLLPGVFVLLFFEGGIVATLVALFFLVISLIFLTISTYRIFTKELLKKGWFWLTILGALLVLFAVVYFYLM